MTVVVVTPAGPLHRTLNSTEQKIFFSTKKKPFFFFFMREPGWPLRSERGREPFGHWTMMGNFSFPPLVPLAPYHAHQALLDSTTSRSALTKGHGDDVAGGTAQSPPPTDEENEGHCKFFTIDVPCERTVCSSADRSPL